MFSIEASAVSAKASASKTPFPPLITKFLVKVEKSSFDLFSVT